MSRPCCGKRRYGGAFTMGPPQWVPCEEAAQVELTVDGEQFDACLVC